MNFVNKLEKSRGVILEMLENRGFDTSKYSSYSLSEIDIMYKNSPVKPTARHRSPKRTLSMPEARP